MPAQRIVRAFPPNFSTLKRAFNLDPAAGVIFSYGETIYIPNQRTPLPPALVVHEAVHGERQLAHPRGVAGWWDEYVADPGFRLSEELPAHRAEYAWHRLHEGRGGRERALTKIASRLSGPLYGRMIDFVEAKKMIEEPAAP